MPSGADSYEPPSLTDLGTLEELTKGGGPYAMDDIQALGYLRSPII